MFFAYGRDQAFYQRQRLKQTLSAPRPITSLDRKTNTFNLLHNSYKPIFSRIQLPPTAYAMKGLDTTF